MAQKNNLLQSGKTEDSHDDISKETKSEALKGLVRALQGDKNEKEDFPLSLREELNVHLQIIDPVEEKNFKEVIVDNREHIIALHGDTKRAILALTRKQIRNHKNFNYESVYRDGLMRLREYLRKRKAANAEVLETTRARHKQEQAAKLKWAALVKTLILPTRKEMTGIMYDTFKGFYLHTDSGKRIASIAPLWSSLSILYHQRVEDVGKKTIDNPIGKEIQKENVFIKTAEFFKQQIAKAETDPIKSVVDLDKDRMQLKKYLKDIMDAYRDSGSVEIPH